MTDKPNLEVVQIRDALEQAISAAMLDYMQKSNAAGTDYAIAVASAIPLLAREIAVMIGSMSHVSVREGLLKTIARYLQATVSDIADRSASITATVQ